MTNTGKVTKALFGLTSILFLAVILGSFYTFYIQKDYNFVVETPCSEGEFCFIRYCSDGECPPNELERYRVFSLKASEFEKCSNDSCELSCRSGLMQCQEVLCDEESGDTCTAVFATE